MFELSRSNIVRELSTILAAPLSYSCTSYKSFMQRSPLLEDMTERPSSPRTVGKDGSLSPSAGHCRLCKPTGAHRGAPLFGFSESMSSPLSNRGRPCGRGGQRGAARGGGQPGQRLDPQTGLQEHTRYRRLMFQVPPLLMVIFFFFFLDASELHSVVFPFSFFCSNVCEGVPAGERRVCG